MHRGTNSSGLLRGARERWARVAVQVIGAPTALHNLTALSLSLLSQKMDFLFRLQTLQDTHHTGEHTAPPPPKKEVFISFEALRTHYKKIKVQHSFCSWKAMRYSKLDGNTVL